MIIPTDYLNIYTTENQAKQINSLLLKYTHDNITITDATAGIGGNSLQFCKCFKNVICIENNYNTFNVLKENLKNFQNSKCYICSFNYVKYMTKQDVIFIDPPWGGNDYKLKKKINLYLDNTDVIDIINTLYYRAYIIMLKVPNNFNIPECINLFWMHKVHNIYKSKKVVYKIIVFYKPI